MSGRALLTVHGLKNQRAYLYLPAKYYLHYRGMPDGTASLMFDHDRLQADGYDYSVEIRDCDTVDIRLRSWAGPTAFAEVVPLTEPQTPTLLGRIVDWIIGLWQFNRIRRV
jgi:hypothetical protein